mmetsp:Transcript_29600/g.55782  ORF Transcript_29600/g.55782 Transcript_29600/m.55782 type:complete len:203 (-) Transcript_29600:351-959(-)
MVALHHNHQVPPAGEPVTEPEEHEEVSQELHEGVVDGVAVLHAREDTLAPQQAEHLEHSQHAQHVQRAAPRRLHRVGEYVVRQHKQQVRDKPAIQVVVHNLHPLLQQAALAVGHGEEKLENEIKHEEQVQDAVASKHCPQLQLEKRRLPRRHRSHPHQAHHHDNVPVRQLGRVRHDHKLVHPGRKRGGAIAPARCWRFLGLV